MSTVESQRRAQESKPMSPPGLEDALGRTRRGGLDLSHTGNRVAQQRWHGEAAGSAGGGGDTRLVPGWGFHSYRLWVPLWAPAESCRQPPGSSSGRRPSSWHGLPTTIGVRVHAEAQHTLWRQAGRERWGDKHTHWAPPKRPGEVVPPHTTSLPCWAQGRLCTGAPGESFCFPPFTSPLQPLPCPALPSGFRELRG